MGENTGGPARDDAPSPPRLTVGGLVAGGRYELLESHGGVAGQAFWKARDKRLSRTVALTFVDPLPGEEPPGSATGVLDRTVALTAVYSDGLARVLDVIRGRAGGIVVSEWIPGRSLAATVADPDPDSAVGAVWGLSDAATRTEEADLALGLDSPDRVRLTEDGRAVLAFPGVSAGVDDRADVRGLGAVLYALLTGKWPLELPEGSGSHDPVDGRPGPAPRDDDDKILDATEVGSGVAPESAVLAMRSLDGSAVSSASTVRTMVTDRVGGPVRSSTPTTRFTAPPAAAAGAAAGAATAGTVGAGGTVGAAGAVRVEETSTSTGSPAGPGGVGESSAASSSSGSSPHPTTSSGAPTSPHARSSTHAPSATHTAGAVAPGASAAGTWGESSDDPDPDVQKRRWQIMASVGAAAVVAIVLLSVWMLGALSNDQNDTPLSQQLDAIERAAQASRSAAAAEPEDTGSSESGEDQGDGAEGAAEPEAAATPIEVSTVTSWQPSSANGNAENSSSAPNVIDGDPSTSWSTDTYRNQFGTGPSAYKAGLGLMFALDGEQEVREIELLSEDDIRFEIRTADTASPTSLDDTTRLGSGRTRDGSATVEIDDPAEAEYILVWITRLGTSGTQAYDASITEVQLLG